MNYAIEIEGLNVKVADFELRDITMKVPKGVVVGLIGRNGAGKTTLLKTMTDVYLPESGSVCYDGICLQQQPVPVKQSLGIVYDSMFYPESMKAFRIAKTVSRLYPDFEMERWHHFMQRFSLDEKRPPVFYSKGMQMKFMLAMVFARNPKVLLLDEPTAGLDPAARAELMELIQEYMMDETHTVIFSTHITSDLDKIADYIALIEKGKLTLFEEKDRLLQEYSLVQVEREAMTDALRERLIGVKENAFGYIGLASERSGLADLEKVKISRPTVEDLIIYGE